MPFLTQSFITTSESEDSISFLVERKRGWVERIVGITVVAFFTWQAYSIGSLVWLAFSLIAIVGIVVDWLRGPITELVVTKHEIISRGNVGRVLSGLINIHAGDVISIAYGTGGENDPSGLYIEHGWSNTCMLRNISEEDASRIAHDIYRKFPEIGTGDGKSGSLLFGSRNDLTTLGLS